MIRVMVIDDEPLARDGMRALLAREPDVRIVGESAGGATARAALVELRPDLLFLDIAMPDLDGFGLLDQIPPAERPLVIFVTAHSDQALRAFDVRALDYVTKPVRRDRLAEAMSRARERLQTRGTSTARPTTLALKLDGRLRLIEQATIGWIEADDDHVIVHAGGQAWRTRETLAEMERRLDPALFARIHRSTIVRLAEIRELQPWFRGDQVVILRDGTKLRMSRTFRARVADLLG